MQIAFGNAIGLTNANLKNYVNSLKPKAWFKSTDLGAQGYSLDFDGTDDYVEADNEITAYPFTLECWVRLDILNARILSISNTTAGNIRYGMGTVSLAVGGPVYFYILSQNTTTKITTGNTEVSTNTWYHISGVFESDTSRTLYVNGVAEATQSDNVTFNNSADNKVNMGRHFTTSSFLNGKLSDVRVWNTARTAQQIADNYNKRLIGNESGLVGYWKLDEGNATSAKDYTSNANNGTISGAVWNNDEPFTENISDFTGVRVWKDISGNGYDAEQSTSANRPTYRTNQINGKPALVFDGTDDRLALGASALGMLRNVAGATAFAVLKYPANSALNLSIFIGNNTDAGQARMSLSQENVNKIQTAGRRLDANGFQSAISIETITNVFRIHSGILNYATAKAFNYNNGILDGIDDPFQTAGNTSDTDSLNITIGATGAPSAFLNGAIAEIIIFNRALTNGELSLVHQYLKQEYAL